MGMELSIKTKQAAPLGILESVLNAGKEHGDVLAMIHKSMEDGKLTMREQEQ
jgi:hypothetical protein